MLCVHNHKCEFYIKYIQKQQQHQKTKTAAMVVVACNIQKKKNRKKTKNICFESEKYTNIKHLSSLTSIWLSVWPLCIVVFSSPHVCNALSHSLSLRWNLAPGKSLNFLTVEAAAAMAAGTCCRSPSGFAVVSFFLLNKTVFRLFGNLVLLLLVLLLLLLHVYFFDWLFGSFFFRVVHFPSVFGKWNWRGKIPQGNGQN